MAERFILETADDEHLIIRMRWQNTMKNKENENC